MPVVPFSKRNSSLAIAWGRPSTCAMPSPELVTRPTSSGAARSGVKSCTKLSSALRISSELMLSSAMASCLPRFSMCPRGQVCGDQASCLRAWSRVAAIVPSITSSPMSTRTPPSTSGSTLMLRSTGAA